MSRQANSGGGGYFEIDPDFLHWNTSLLAICEKKFRREGIWLLNDHQVKKVTKEAMDEE